jgi:CrcB protein
LATHHGLPTGPTVVLSAGFCSGYTTWSTYAWESLALAETGALLQAAANLVGSLVLGLAAAVAGLGLALL